MKKLSASQQKKIKSIIEKLNKIQYDLFSFPNQNAGDAAFEIDSVLQKLEDFKTWYVQK